MSGRPAGLAELIRSRIRPGFFVSLSFCDVRCRRNLKGFGPWVRAASLYLDSSTYLGCAKTAERMSSAWPALSTVDVANARRTRVALGAAPETQSMIDASSPRCAAMLSGACGTNHCEQNVAGFEGSSSVARQRVMEHTALPATHKSQRSHAVLAGTAVVRQPVMEDPRAS